MFSSQAYAFQRLDSHSSSSGTFGNNHLPINFLFSFHNFRKAEGENRLCRLDSEPVMYGCNKKSISGGGPPSHSKATGHCL